MSVLSYVETLAARGVVKLEVSSTSPLAGEVAR
jgi:hypothetical protein